MRARVSDNDFTTLVECYIKPRRPCDYFRPQHYIYICCILTPMLKPNGEGMVEVELLVRLGHQSNRKGKV